MIVTHGSWPGNPNQTNKEKAEKRALMQVSPRKMGLNMVNLHILSHIGNCYDLLIHI